MGIRENIEQIKEKIEKAAKKVDRDPETIKLVAVTKKVDIQRILEAIEAGVNILGENYVQEARDKINKLERTVKWHFIGYLQKNKVKQAVELFEMFHSVDRLELAKELNIFARKKSKIIPVLIQVNLTNENSKHGVKRDNLIELINGILTLENLSLRGLMTIPPFFDNPENSRPYFQELRTLKEKMNVHFKGLINMEELSMGMSNDFEIAIEEGSTMVRIGTAIFGKRN